LSIPSIGRRGADALRRSGTLRIAAVASLAVIVAGAGIAMVWWRPGAQPGAPALPSAAQEIDRLATATAVATKLAFTGSCRQSGLAFAFDVKGDVTVYGDATRTVVAQPVKPQAVFTANNYEPPATISLDAAWWEVSGRKAGPITLSGRGDDPRAQAPVALTCDVDLPAAS
jgi:hypothetical protein